MPAHYDILVEERNGKKVILGAWIKHPEAGGFPIKKVFCLQLILDPLVQGITENEYLSELGSMSDFEDEDWLMENEETYSTYTEQGQQMLNANPNRVAQILLKRSPLPEDLEGVRIYIVYNPADREQDRRFSEMTAIYERLLKERHASIKIQATNKFYEP